MKNSTFAIPADAVAMPMKPKMPAMIAIMKNTIAQYSIKTSFFVPCSQMTFYQSHQTGHNVEIGSGPKKTTALSCPDKFAVR
jgi:hypothetical protein